VPGPDAGRPPPSRARRGEQLPRHRSREQAPHPEHLDQPGRRGRAHRADEGASGPGRPGRHPGRADPELDRAPAVPTIDATVRSRGGSNISSRMSETRIDVRVEQVESAPAAKQHPNTCPSCGSHYRDDELEAALYVCGQCGHHFRMSAHARIAFLTDPESFAEEAAEVRSADPLSFFDLKPYRQRLAAAAGD